MDCMSTDFDAASSSHFPFRANCSPILGLGLGFDLLTSGSMLAKVLQTLVLIARAIFLLDHGQTDR